MRCSRCLTLWIFVALVIASLGFSGSADAATATLTWTDNSNNELGFNIERKVEACAGTGPWSALTSVAINATGYVDVTVTPGGSYCYRVNAWNTVDGTPNGTKQYSAWSNTAGLTVPLAPAAAPSQLGVTSGP